MWGEQGARWGAERTKSRPMVTDDSAATRTRDDDSTCTCLGLHLVVGDLDPDRQLHLVSANRARARVFPSFLLYVRACMRFDERFPRIWGRVLGPVLLPRGRERTVVAAELEDQPELQRADEGCPRRRVVGASAKAVDPSWVRLHEVAATSSTGAETAATSSA